MRQPVRTLPVPACSGADPRLDRRSSQRHYYDEACDPEFETTRPHTCGRLYQFLIAQKFQTGVEALRLDLAGKSVLEICCGSGMMSEQLASRGARVTGIDCSSAAIARAWERARRYDFSARFVVADAGNLPLPVRWFEWPPLFRLFRAGFWGVNLVLGRWGNKLALAGLRKENG